MVRGLRWRLSVIAVILTLAAGPLPPAWQDARPAPLTGVMCVAAYDDDGDDDRDDDGDDDGDDDDAVWFRHRHDRPRVATRPGAGRTSRRAERPRRRADRDDADGPAPEGRGPEPHHVHGPDEGLAEIGGGEGGASLEATVSGDHADDSAGRRGLRALIALTAIAGTAGLVGMAYWLLTRADPHARRAGPDVAPTDALDGPADGFPLMPTMVAFGRMRRSGSGWRWRRHGRA
ncbi:MAG TPA: hypothetical protein VFV66_13085 [Nonomuraea sp.]|nr:hypothetical protein [Nonomuraea sp.]